MQLPPLMCGFVWRYYNVSKAIINNPYLMVYITHWNFGDGLRLPNITSYSSGSSEVFTIQNGPFLRDIPHFKAPRRDGSKPLGVTKRGGVDHVLTQAYLHFRSYPHSILLNISMNISMGWYIQIYTYTYIYIYIDVFIELYCDISDIPLKYVFFIHISPWNTTSNV